MISVPQLDFGELLGFITRCDGCSSEVLSCRGTSPAVSHRRGIELAKGLYEFALGLLPLRSADGIEGVPKARKQTQVRAPVEPGAWVSGSYDITGLASKACRIGL